MKTVRFFWLLLLLFSVSILVSPDMMANDKRFTVVLDAGHGGKDPGAISKNAKEKDINLKMAMNLGLLIAKNCPDVNIVYTRTSDVFLPLQDRADIANKNKADLFISFHANSISNTRVNGFETFVLGTDKLDDNLEVAMFENKVITLEDNYKITYQGFDPEKVESYIMFEL
ncbi:MAG: N-acetylmuramoyl-L-alanine amidase, partial [Paludibacteraceae bacterium]|nr:N-acetylmuramoyl-L-alanine amidase [Paludibacteraceae bacterium]